MKNVSHRPERMSRTSWPRSVSNSLEVIGLSRKHNKIIFVVSLSLIALAVIVGASSADQDGIRTGALTLGPADFQQGLLQDLSLSGGGLILADNADSGLFTSAVVKTTFPFNALIPSWLVDIPAAASVTVQIRTSKDGELWSDWIQLALNDDWMVPEDEAILGQMIGVPGEDVTHSYVQFLVSFVRYPGDASPVLRGLNATIFDSTRGPSAAEMVARQEALDAEQVQQTSGYPKPSVVGRATWCTDTVNCNYTDGLEYEPVTHLIVHHTVTGNSSTDWAAIVRAIWRFHTFPDSPSCPGCRGWGDIGYNYLVDMNGVLYEGHLGGDDVVGVHAGGANAGSMALAFIGTFTLATQNPPGISPPAAMRNSAVELFAWKADQKDIDVHRSSYLPNVDWVLPNLMGHRDVYGTTVCPGDQAYAILPWLRDQVAQRVTIETVYADELSAAFTKNDVPGWKVASDSCGDNGHAFYAWSTQNQAATLNKGEWRPQVTKDGFYDLQAFIPYCITGAAETDGATYVITHANGQSTITISQEDHVSTWMSLGTYQFKAGGNALITLNNLTQTDSNLGVWFDALRLVPGGTCLVPTIDSPSPADASWLNSRAVTFSWVVHNGQAVQTTRLQVATDLGFTNKVFDQEFAGLRSSQTVTFAQDYKQLFWQVKLTTTCSHTAYSSIQWFGVDTTPPTSAVNGVYLLDSGRLLVAWSGQDSGVGKLSYNIDYRPEGDPNWAHWLTGFPFGAAYFDPPDGQVYLFRSQAVDKVGNVEPWPSTSDASTADAIPLHRVIIFPLVHF
jgi:hypothetical protein